MHCTSCSINIDGELEDTEGVQEAKTSYVKQETHVTFDPAKVSEDSLCEAVKRAGYKATISS